MAVLCRKEITYVILQACVRLLLTRFCGQCTTCLWVEWKDSTCSCSCVYMPRDTAVLSTAAWLVSSSAMSLVTYPECPRLQISFGGFPLGSWWIRNLILFLTAEPLQASFMPRYIEMWYNGQENPTCLRTFPHQLATCLKFLPLSLPLWSCLLNLPHPFCPHCCLCPPLIGLGFCNHFSTKSLLQSFPRVICPTTCF